MQWDEGPGESLAAKSWCTQKEVVTEKISMIAYSAYMLRTGFMSTRNERVKQCSGDPHLRPRHILWKQLIARVESRKVLVCKYRNFTGFFYIDCDVLFRFFVFKNIDLLYGWLATCVVLKCTVDLHYWNLHGQGPHRIWIRRLTSLCSVWLKVALCDVKELLLWRELIDRQFVNVMLSIYMSHKHQSAMQCFTQCQCDSAPPRCSLITTWVVCR